MTEIATRSGCSTVPHPMHGTVEHALQASGIPRGTPAERTSLKALANKVLRAEHLVEQERNNTQKTPPEQRSIVRNSGTPSGTPAEIAQQRTCLLTAARATLYRLAASEGLPRGIVDRLTAADLHPDHGAHLLSDAGLRRWLHALDENARMRQGMAPPGWTQASHCRRCGPVLLWQGAPPAVLGCPWCHVRRAGGHLPRPAITCAACAHRVLRTDTSAAGMHDCGKGKGLHFARQQHACEGWRPV